ncbi:ABC transporter ATP-binding protein [Hoyosella sp. G463]|uniref:ABC transporter ATP-binding protein n=1 Tax=Lolliginicoccus lacisalsi TaxID=2742202 RepID=A0A927JBE0_9ACTN|nr:ABC transporter ATP-binding protein [Lolliginicoccus lacisalsi]MBD8505993.1 ABC transporter ATP-binding protein [Lolliginicoccus lacisalsi]
MAGTNALEIEGLAKSYGQQPAVRSITLDVPAGSFFGLVGPNGAGKTTTLAMCTGLLRPDIGQARVFGHDTWRDPVAAKSLTGVLPDGLTLIDRLTGAELLRFQGLLRGMDPAVVDERAIELLEVLGLADARDKLIADYSAGMTKKIGLAAAMLHAPRLLVLDEPFEAVDPVSSATIRRILLRYVAGGGTVILSSHVMATVEQLCSHVAIMVHGSIAARGPIDEVRGTETLEDVFVRLVGGRSDDEGELQWLR